MRRDEKGIKDNYKVFGLNNWAVVIPFAEMKNFKEEEDNSIRNNLRATWPTSSMDIVHFSKYDVIT